MHNTMDDDEDRGLFLSALEAAGVDNWEWYGEALDGVDCSDDDAVLDALTSSGVDNWDGYSVAVDYYQEWLRDQDGDGEDSDSDQGVDASEAVAVSEVVEPVTRSARRLAVLIPDEDQAREFWKRQGAGHTVAQFDKALDVVRDGGGLEDARNALLDLVFGEDSGM